MVLPAVNVQMRALDKDFEWFEPYDVLFEQYIDTGLFELGDNTSEQNSSDNFSAKYLTLSKPLSGTDLPCSSPATEWEHARAEPSEPWEKAPGCLEQTSALQAARNKPFSFNLDSDSKAAVADVEPHSLEHSHLAQIKRLTAASSVPRWTFPDAEHCKSRIASQTNDTRKAAFAGISKSIRRVSESPKMMRGSNYRPGFHDIWAQRKEAAMDKYNLQIPARSTPLSPPPSAKVEQEEQEVLFDDPMNRLNHRLEDSLSPLSNQFQTLTHMTPLSTPLMDRYNNQRSSYFSPTVFSDYYEQSDYTVQSIHDIMTPPQSQPLSMSAWAPERHSQEPYEFDATSPDISNWPTENIAQTGVSVAQDNVHHAPHGLSALTNDIPFASTNNNSAAAAIDLSTNGLLIDMHGMPSSTGVHIEGGSGEGSGSATIGGFSALSPTQLKLNHTQGYPAAPSVPASASPINFITTKTTPIGLRQKPSAPEASTDLPLVSPPTRQKNSKSQNAHSSPHQPVRPSHAQRNHRRSKSSSTHSQHSPTRAHRRHNRTQSSSSPSSGEGGNVGFVNFTPDDSRKILTGVAPSGSSKTKARREKEAAEKRRKLSEAALKAVEEAGGDISVLDDVVFE